MSLTTLCSDCDKRDIQKSFKIADYFSWGLFIYVLVDISYLLLPRCCCFIHILVKDLPRMGVNAAARAIIQAPSRLASSLWGLFISSTASRYPINASAYCALLA